MCVAVERKLAFDDFSIVGKEQIMTEGSIGVAADP